jgi:hypothetical protein
MDLEALQKQFRGRRFGELILHHRKVNDLETTIAAVHAVTAQLPPTAQPLVESWIDEMNPQSRSEQFWQQDCGEALAAITAAARAKLRSARVEPTTDDLFNMFQIVVLSFSYATHLSNRSKAFIEKALWGWHPRQALSLAMQPSSALVVTALCAACGTIAGYPHLWLPYTGVAASVMTVFTHSWVVSDRLGRWVPVSVLLKSALAVIGLYALLAQFACVGLGMYWALRK